MLSIYRLPGQIPGEKVIKVFRCDFIVFVNRFLFISFLTILPFGFAFLFKYFIYPDLLENEVLKALLILFLSFYTLFMWLFLFFSFMDYYLDAWVVTSERLIDIEQKGFFSRVISEQRLENVQDVTSEVNGLMATVFGYGNVFVQSAGRKERFDLFGVANPEDARDLIIKLTQAKKGRLPMPPSDVSNL